MNIAVQDTAAATRLAALAERARAELAMLSFATKPWVLPRRHEGRVIPDVVILGAGQSGLVLGHALKRRGLGNILILDRNPEGFEGVWETYARNYEIRSPKEVMGADLGLPSMTIQSWFTARHGPGAWEEIKRVPRRDWMDFLRWYRAVADLPIRNGVAVTDIAHDAAGVTLTTDQGEVIRTRYLVLATGMDGGGAWVVPEMIRAALPPGIYNHSCDIADVSRLAGKDVGILGAGAAAFDVAVASLEAGARQVEMFLRRPVLPMIDVAREFETAGYLDHGSELPDATKWELSKFLGGLSQSPAEHHFLKAMEFPNFRLRPGAPWDRVRAEEGRAVVTTPKGEFRFDHVFAATGVTVDMALRPELARIAKGAALWRHRFVAPEGPEAPGLGFPYLGRDYRFQEREPGCAPGIDRIFAFNALAALSMGTMSAVSISCHRYGVPKIASGLTRALFLDQQAEIVPMLAAYDRPGIELPPHVRRMLGMEEDGAPVKGA